MSELMCSQSKCRRKDEHIAELEAELEKYVLKESGWVAYDIRVQSELQSKDQELAELRVVLAQARKAANAAGTYTLWSCGEMSARRQVGRLKEAIKEFDALQEKGE